MYLVIERDGIKAASNKQKHGVAFSEAASAFGDKLMLTKADMRDPGHGERLFSIGRSVRGRLMAISHTEESNVIRIISARKATGRERGDYEESE